MRGDTTRGQTSVDFAIAMGVFLIAVTTVIAFMPTIIQPFTGAQANPLLADRLTMHLADYQLGDPTAPSALNATCTMYFFNGSAIDEPCPAFEAEDSLNEKLGVEQRRLVNVTIQANVSGTPATEVLCTTTDWYAGTGERVAGDCSDAAYDSNNRLAIGADPVNAGGSVTAARRKGTLGDRNVYVVVRVWA